MKKLISFVLLISGVLFLMVGCQSGGGKSTEPVVNQGSAPSSSSSSGNFSQKAPRFKKTIAVSQFVSKVKNYRGGAAMADMLTDALIQSKQYVVLERQTLSDVLIEQDFAAGPRAAKALKSAQIGKVVPAQLLIMGTISEYSAGTGSSGSGASFMGLSLQSNSSESHIGLIIRIIDTTSGQVIDSVRVEGKQKAASAGGGACLAGICTNTNSSASDTTAQATQVAIDRAVVKITERTGNVPFVGKVVNVKGASIFTNIGERNGAMLGDAFSVYAPGEELIDPDTGESLGSDKTKVGSLKLNSVQEKFSVASIETGKEFQKGFILQPE
jgi:curli biogenesis system outer membrane secretion channel CsgG